jgi:hypothetical protein
MCTAQTFCVLRKYSNIRERLPTGYLQGHELLVSGPKPTGYLQGHELLVERAAPQSLFPKPHLGV